MIQTSNLIFKTVPFASPEYEESVKLRYEVLRKPIHVDFEPGALAKEGTDFHLTAWLDGRIVACLVMTPQNDKAVRMRQVAVAFDLQKQGIGKKLVAWSEEWSVENGFDEIVLHARLTAVPFYLALGYETLGNEFIEVTIPHFMMRKQLSVPNSLIR